MSTNGTYIDGKKIGKGKEQTTTIHTEISIIRQNAFRISYVLYPSTSGESSSEVSFLDKYIIRHSIGEGAYATVKLAIDKEDGRRYALKEIDKNKHSTKPREQGENPLMAEVNMLNSLDHPHIIKVHNAYEVPRIFYILLEYAESGDLLEYMLQHNRPLAEPAARDLFVQLLEAVEYLHAHNITHRDIKPENVLVLREPSDDDRRRPFLMPLGASRLRVKLTDFGLSRITDEKQYMQTICGTPQYLAPEVIRMSPLNSQLEEVKKSNIKLGYDKGVDMWSLGAILFVILTLQQPFEDDDLANNILAGRFAFPSHVHISAEAKELVTGLLTVDPAARFTIDDVRRHPWIRALARERDELYQQHYPGMMPHHELSDAAPSPPPRPVVASQIMVDLERDSCPMIDSSLVPANVPSIDDMDGFDSIRPKRERSEGDDHMNKKMRNTY
jgi:serine/threonine-protein kinase Chk2